MASLKVFSELHHDARIFVAGHGGLVGSSIVRKLKGLGFSNLALKSRRELDLTDQLAVERFFRDEHIDFVFLAAAKVGGILYNSRFPVEFLYENLMIAANVINSSANYGVKKLLYLGSSCIYPKLAQQPISEDALLSGPLEPSNEGYALAKIAGLKLCEKYNLQYGKKFVSVMPTNMYGPNDNYHPEHSHVIPGMMRRFHEAKVGGLPSVTVWGTGAPKREFLHVDDFASAALVVMEHYNGAGTLNVGTGQDVTIRELAEVIKRVVGYSGEIVFDTSKPDGTPRKVLDVTKIKKLGWSPEINLEEGLLQAYHWATDSGAFSLGRAELEGSRSFGSE
jgi:GDP-L-fucose synthase